MTKNKIISINSIISCVGRYTGEMVSKLTVEEREQELLAKEETIQVCDTNI